MPYKPNFIPIVPCGPVGTTPFTDSFRVIQLFGACPANFILLIIKGSNPFVQKRWPCLISIWGLYFFTEKQMTTVGTLGEEEGGSRIFSHPKLKTWSLSLPRAYPLATFCFAAFFAGALIKHDLCPRLPLARIYCITSKKTIKIFGTHIYPYFGNTTIIERPIRRSWRYVSKDGYVSTEDFKRFWQSWPFFVMRCHDFVFSIEQSLGCTVDELAGWCRVDEACTCWWQLPLFAKFLSAGFSRPAHLRAHNSWWDHTPLRTYVRPYPPI